jgi:hypothetical protein
MPIDFSFDSTPNFRDLTQTGLVLLRQPVVRSLAKLRLLRQGAAVVKPRALRPVKSPSGTR